MILVILDPDHGTRSRIRILIFIHPGSRGQKATGSRIHDPQHCLAVLIT